jgi:hypothetical protein
MHTSCSFPLSVTFHISGEVNSKYRCSEFVASFRVILLINLFAYLHTFFRPCFPFRFCQTYDSLKSSVFRDITPFSPLKVSGCF